MTSGRSRREQVLGSVRRALGVSGDEAGRRGKVRARLEHPQAGPIPARAAGDRAALVTLFVQMLEREGAVVRRIEDRAQLPTAIAQTLQAENLPLIIRSGNDPLLADLPWAQAAPLKRLIGPAEPDDIVSLSRAKAGAAETGTLFLVSGAENPSTLNFLPEVHFVVIRREDIYGSYEEAWNSIRAAHGRGRMPRTVNLISAPSRTADIEQTLIKGAHGPRRLMVFIVG